MLNLELHHEGVEVSGNLGPSLRLCQCLIVLFYNCHIRNVNRVRIPGISIVNHKLLGDSLHQRVRYVLLFNCAFDIREFREEQLRSHVSCLERMGLFWHISPYVATKRGHCSRVVQTHISLRLPFKSFGVKDIVITSKIVKIDICEAWTCWCWLS